ncbi:kinase-regulated stress-responsive transcription factor skn7 [Basidiobolus ranarum]|uniref:Transcription factor n=1 Tax=Basidiobolus ranarum TaxID=34480 RepID=A0ABR2W119_9FUNG
MSTPPGVPDFVKKLYRMLEDSTHNHIVSWGMNGDTFVVREPNEFARNILPKHFKHNNFASFVRQLNKYDFHKIKNSEDSNKPYGDQAWEFQHPKFQYNKRELLEMIKRKIPNKNKALTGVGSLPDEMKAVAEDLHYQIGNVTKAQSDMGTYLQSLSKNYQMVIEEILLFRKSMMAQDQLMHNLIQYLVNRESKSNENSNASPYSTGSSEALKLLNTYNEISKANVNQGAEMDKRAQILQQFAASSMDQHISNSDYLGLNDNNRGYNSSNNDGQRGANQSAWSVPPKVLLVEDDTMCQRLSGKLLQIFGCSFDIATDGVAAVNRMNLEKYDIVFMDIVMPNLDGVSATSRIRQFDSVTPIISMTSNTTENDCMTYLATGMNDILAKPFSKAGLYSMLEKYCIHLRAMRNMRETSRNPSLNTSTLPPVMSNVYNSNESNDNNNTSGPPYSHASAMNDQQHNGYNISLMAGFAVPSVNSLSQNNNILPSIMFTNQNIRANPDYPYETNDARRKRPKFEVIE